LLGFIAVTLSLAVTRRSPQISPILPLFVIGLPIIDTLSVVVQRIIAGRSPFIADKKHLHHKIMRLGFYHSESVVLIYIIHAILLCFAFFFRYESDHFLFISFIILSTTIIISILVAEDREWRIKRYPIIDKLIKGPLRRLREEHIIITVSFKAIQIGFIAILIFACFLPKSIHIYLSFIAIIFLLAIFLTWHLKRKWTSNLIEIIIFLMIPFLVYLAETDVIYLKNTFLKDAFNLCFGLLIFFAFLTLKFTRRRKGFKTNPLDFLIIFIALVVPNLPDDRIKEWQMGFIATKIIVLFFTYEILKGELRLDAKKLGIPCILALFVISIRGFIG